ncbi:MAG: hypothetical protein ACI8PZ_000888 [Myxococcota bacterium]|jgi:hypothetical protein
MLRSAPWMILFGCAQAETTWSLDTWGELFIAEGIDDTVFVDGCSVTFDRFEVVVAKWSLDSTEGPLASSDRATRRDLVQDEPQRIAQADLPSAAVERLTVVVDGGDGPSIAVAGVLTCGDATATFDWDLMEPASYDCDLGGTLSMELARTELTVHGDHLFYDDLADPDAVVRGLAFMDADADLDGRLTPEELQATPVQGTGYGVGPHGDVVTLWDFVQRAATTVGHVDGEGHCTVTAG